MKRLPESELDIMLALWEAEQPPVSRTYFDNRLRHKEWSVNALNSFLTRLEEKGFLKSERQGKHKLYAPVIRREDYLAHEGRSMLQKMYKGSLKNFVLSISDHETMADHEIDELKAYLDELKGGRGHGR